MARGSRSSGGSSYAANSYRTEGLVLRTYKLGEADRIIVLLTPDLGQIRAVAKGVRRTSSKFGATLEPFMHTQLQLVRGKSLDVVSQAVTLHSYGSLLAADYDSFGMASAMAETAERLSRDDDSASGKAQYRLLHGALAALTHRYHVPRATMDSYLLRALSTAGWAPSFTVCARCGAPGPHHSVNIAVGGTVCDDCRPPGSLTPAPETMSLLAALLVGDWQKVDAVETKHLVEADRIISRYMQFHVERSLKSLSVMEQV